MGIKALHVHCDQEVIDLIHIKRIVMSFMLNQQPPLFMTQSSTGCNPDPDVDYIMSPCDQNL